MDTRTQIRAIHHLLSRIFLYDVPLLHGLIEGKIIHIHNYGLTNSPPLGRNKKVISLVVVGVKFKTKNRG